MALIKQDIKDELLAVYNAAKDGSKDEDAFADLMADALINIITSADVTVTGVQPGAGTASGTIS